MRAIRVTVVLGLVGVLTACGSPDGVGSTGASPSATPSSPTASPTAASPAPPGPTGTLSAPPPPPPPPGQPQTLQKVTVTKSGGIAGVQQTVRISPDGSWLFVDKRAFGENEGQLNATEVTDLAALLNNPGFAMEARAAPPPPGACNDAFVYTIAVGDLSVRHDQCDGTAKRPLTERIVTLIATATPL